MDSFQQSFPQWGGGNFAMVCVTRIFCNWRFLRNQILLQNGNKKALKHDFTGSMRPYDSNSKARKYFEHVEFFWKLGAGQMPSGDTSYPRKETAGANR